MKCAIKLLILCISFAGVSASSLAEEMLYWSNWSQQAISRLQPDAETPEVICSGFQGRGIAVDRIQGYLYWTDRYRDEANRSICQIKRSRLDGTAVTVLVEREAFLWQGIAVDSARQQIYWTQWIDSLAGNIWRSNMDGSQAEVLIQNAAGPQDIAIDTVNQHIYWTSYNEKGLWRADLDGTNVTALAHFDSNTNHLALDTANQHIYVTVSSPMLYGNSYPSIHRLNSDASENTVIYSSFGVQLKGIAVHPENNRLYFAENIVGVETASIFACDTDGSDLQTIAAEATEIWALAFCPVASCQVRPQADIDGDCRVNFSDFAILAAEWLNCGILPPSEC